MRLEYTLLCNLIIYIFGYFQTALKSLGSGMADSVQEIYTKTLRKVSQQSSIYDDEDIDDTQLT